jgi:hypothetical protein
LHAKRLSFHLYSYMCLQQLVPELGFLEFHALVPRTIHVHQCKSAKHNNLILPCTIAKSVKRNKRILLDQSPRRQPWLSVRRMYSACSALARLWTQSCGCVTLKSCMGNHILRTHSFWSNFLTRPVLFRPSRKVWTKFGPHAVHKQARIVVPQTCYTVSTYCRTVRFEIHRYIYTCIHIICIHISGVMCPIYVT